VRDAARVHGLEKQLEGYIPGAHDVAAVIDDVLTTGGSIRYVRDALAAQGTRCGGVYVVVQRRDVDLGTPIHALTHADDFTGGHH
jgi:orotate phosphoribosyltransferase